MSRATHAQNEQQLFKAAFERSLEAIVILNQEHQLVELNRAACQLLGAQRTTLLGQSIAKLLPGLAETLSTAALQSTEAVHEVHRPHADGTTQTLAYTCIANVLPHRHLVTLQDTTRLKRATGAELRRQHQRAELLSEVTLKIRQSLQLEEILQTAVTEVQRILQADRVLIYQVFANGTGMSISEAVLPTFAPILGVEFPEEVFPEEYRTLYAQGRVQAIAHVQSPDSGVAECLVDFMNEWDVQAKLIAP
ncbi:MAG: PAS domain S-box protein, partial [Cyanobacteria bacterium P01_H01_bin.121]